MADQIYTYDDLSIGFQSFPPPPSLLYDEQCFYYDGGYDLICLQGINQLPKRRLGKSGKTKKTYPEKDMIQIIFKTKIIGFGKETVKKYKINNTNIVVKTNNLVYSPKSIKIKSHIIK